MVRKLQSMQQALENAQNFTRTLYMDLKHKSELLAKGVNFKYYDMVSPAGVHSDLEVYALFFKQQ